MWSIILVFHVLVAMALIALVLLQQGKGADAGAAFGSGASQTVFGSRGSGSFLTRTTGILATLFFVTSLSLAYLSGDHAKEVVPEQILPVEQPADAPAPAPSGDAQTKQSSVAETPVAPSAPSPAAPSPAAPAGE